MVSTGKLAANQTRRPHNHRQPPQQPKQPKFIQDLLSSLQSSQELKLSELKRLYYLLVQLVLDSAITESDKNCGADLSFPDIRICLHGVLVPFANICSLSDILFKMLFEMFKEFLSGLHSASASLSEQDTLHLNTCTTAERLNLLLRCCIVMIELLVLDQNRLLENGRVLHAILVKLCSLNLNQENENTIRFEKVSQEYRYDDTCFSLFSEDFVASLQFIEPIDCYLHFFSAMLEVFVDELLVHGRLREYFELIDSCSSNKLFVSCPYHGDFGSVIKVICAHTCLSFSDEQTLESMDSKLFGFHRGDFRVPEIGPLSALTLLLNPLMLTAPKYFQAHLISLVSESIISDMGLENGKLDVRLLDCYLTTFEKSVILYSNYMSTLEMSLYSASCHYNFHKFGRHGGSSQPLFESYLGLTMRKQLDYLVSKLDNSLQLQLKHMRPRSKPNLIASSIACVRECKNILNPSFEDEIISILSSIISSCFSDEVVGNASCTIDNASPGNMYLLASIMKLMSCSLLQATRCLMYAGDSGCLRTLKDLSSCKEYSFITEIISCFQNCNISLPVRKPLRTMMATYPEKHKNSSLMFIHFLGLLSLSFKVGIEFLTKGCLLIIVTLMNLFIFEEGNLNALKLEDGSELFPSELPKENGREVMVGKRSSFVVASRFEKIQALYLRPSLASSFTGTENGLAGTLTSALVSNDPQCVTGTEEETEEICDGRFFLKCVIKNDEKLHDLDDLADFIECKKGKNYHGWLKDRQRYRKRKCEKMALVKWKRKKRIWSFVKGNRA